MIKKILEAFVWGPTVDVGQTVRELSERVATLELELAKLIKAYGDQEGAKSPDYHG